MVARCRMAGVCASFALLVAGCGDFDFFDFDGETQVREPAVPGTRIDDPNRPLNPDPVCVRWRQDRVDLSEPEWRGGGSCRAGEIDDGRNRVLRVLNTYRWLAGLPEVESDPERDRDAQACARLMHANDSLDHTPPEEWSCYSEAGGAAAARSNLAATAAVFANDLYMLDHGNEAHLGHRRWILGNDLGPVGIGSTDSYSCLWVTEGRGDAGAAWVAWPPPGVVPIEVFHFGFSSLDVTGWSVQSDTIDLAGASVTVREGGRLLPTSVRVLEGSAGGTSAISFAPRGWRTEAGRTYEVEIGGVDETIAYEVRPARCE